MRRQIRKLSVTRRQLVLDTYQENPETAQIAMINFNLLGVKKAQTAPVVIQPSDLVGLDADGVCMLFTQLISNAVELIDDLLGDDYRKGCEA